MTTKLRNQWQALIDTYGQMADSDNSARLIGAARIASATHAPQTAGWYATAITVFWN
jgi:hypothetical protein